MWVKSNFCLSYPVELGASHLIYLNLNFFTCKTGIPIAPTSKDGCDDNVIICLAYSKHPILLVEVGRGSFPDGSVVKNLPTNGGDSGSIPGS